MIFIFFWFAWNRYGVNFAQQIDLTAICKQISFWTLLLKCYFCFTL